MSVIPSLSAVLRNRRVRGMKGGGGGGGEVDGGGGGREES